MLGLSSRYMASTGLEYHQQLSFMKAGLGFSDRVTTVSPTYAREIATHEFGAGLEGVIQGRGTDVIGVLNGVDGAVWDPATDAGIAARYSPTQLENKAKCKLALQTELGLTPRADAPIFGVVSRLNFPEGAGPCARRLADAVAAGRPTGPARQRRPGARGRLHRGGQGQPERGRGADRL